MMFRVLRVFSVASVASVASVLEHLLRPASASIMFVVDGSMSVADR